MIDMTKLISGIDNRPRQLRYETDEMRRSRQPRTDGKPELVPLVEWNTTGFCNLSCQHCYYGAQNSPLPGELTHEEAIRFIDDVAEMNIPVLVFSGGEPLLRKDLFELASYAASKRIRPVLSSNGTLITKEAARKLKDAGFQYVGISLDGVGGTNDFFRGKKGAFDQALQGVRNAREAGISVGIRYAMTKDTIDDLPRVFDVAIREGVSRLNIFHLIYSGRGEEIVSQDLPFERTRAAVDYIYEKTRELAKTHPEFQVLTAGNYCDAPYIFQKIQRDNPEWAPQAWKLLFAKDAGRVVKMGDGGPKLVSVDHEGNVHPSMFLSKFTFGNVKRGSLREILENSALFEELSYPEQHVKGRCKECAYLGVCGGNSRARAEAVTGDLWGEDPRCYLTDAEIHPSTVQASVSL